MPEVIAFLSTAAAAVVFAAIVVPGVIVAFHFVAALFDPLDPPFPR